GAAGTDVFAAPPTASRHEAPASRMASSHAAKAASPESLDAVLNEYCLGCHDRDGKAGGLSLQDFEPAQPHKQAETAEKMIHKLRAGLIPPAGAPRPDATTE